MYNKKSKHSAALHFVQVYATVAQFFEKSILEVIFALKIALFQRKVIRDIISNRRTP